jgi:phospholipid-transporting ATPase
MLGGRPRVAPVHPDGASMKADEATRCITFKGSGSKQFEPSPEAMGEGAKPNAVRNSRFTVITWLPKSLFEQFHRAANVFFLCISIIVFIEPVIAWSTCTVFFTGVLLWTALKDLYEDTRKRRDDDAENCRRCQRFDPSSGSFVQVQWQDIVVGDLLLTLQDEALPADVLVVQPSDEQAFISTVNLDGETNLKERTPPQLLAVLTSQEGREAPSTDGAAEARAAREAAKGAKALFQHGLQLRLDEPKAGLADFGGSVALTTASREVAAAVSASKAEQPCDLMHDNLVPRGCVLRNTTYLLSLVAYVGRETKTRLNVEETKAKLSKMQKNLNRGVQGLVATLMSYLLLITVISLAEGFDEEPETWSSARLVSVDWAPLWIRRILWYWIILYQIVPISLYVCFEVMKLILGYQIGADPQMVDARTRTPARARTADLVEEMGQVNFVFSDKTGTLTENEMVFARCCVQGEDLGDFRDSNSGQQRVLQILDRQRNDPMRAEVRWFFLSLAACHTAQVDTDQNGDHHFSGSSPDEVAFLEACHKMGIVFTSRKRLPGGNGTELFIELPGETCQTLTLLCEIPFNADRKRMTVFCRYEGEIFLICKGADNVIGQLCEEPFDAASVEHVTKYSKLGLRTLAFASKLIQRSHYEEWHKKWMAALVDKQDKERAMAAVAAEMEHSLVLSGFTAIEDKLQEGVPEAIVSLKAAGIRFWVLTGDKTETAVEIVRACQLFTADTTLAYMVNVQSVEDCKVKLEAAVKMLSGATEGGLILDGTFARFALQDDSCRRTLYDLAIASKSCVCCRLSPSQKRKLVELVKEQNLDGITLAIGDGANDVSMIQGAHIGIGIRGKEGNSAVQASDVAISQFSFLVPLLFCHGRRAYRRMAVFLLYMLYKHIAIAAGDMIWAFESRFRGDVGYPEWLNSAYAGLITPFAFFVTLGFDSDLPDEVANKSPSLYAEGIRSVYFNGRIFALWICSALFHGSVAWLVPSMAVGSNDVLNSDFWDASCCSFVLCVLFVNARLWIMSLNPFALRTVIAMSASFLLLFISLFGLSATGLGQVLQPEIQGVPERIFSEGKYLAVMGATGASVVLLDLLIIMGRRKFRPSLLDTARKGIAAGRS